MKRKGKARMGTKYYRGTGRWNPCGEGALKSNFPWGSSFCFSPNEQLLYQSHGFFNLFKMV